MFGYACDETDTLMPAPIYYAHRLMQQQSILRKNGTLPFLRPDAKSQLTVRYVDGRPQSVDTVVLSTQHSPEMSDGDKMKPEFTEAVIESIIKPVLPAEWITPETKFLINRPAASWSAVLRATRVSPAARSSSTPTAAPAARRRRVLRQGPDEG